MKRCCRHECHQLLAADWRGGYHPATVCGVTLAPEVRRELSAALSPEVVRRWAQAPPAWVQIGAGPLPATLSSIAPVLDRGEREAIALAVELSADLILIDDTQGRKEAARLGLEDTGTLGILLAASKLQLVNLPDAIRRLRQSGFFVLCGEFGIWRDKAGQTSA